MESSYNTIDINEEKSYKKNDLSISDAFAGLRIDALTKAAILSPHVKQATIGPRSPLKKEIIIENQIGQIHETDENLMQDTLSKDLRYTLIMKEHKMQLEETTDILFRNLMQNMLLRRANTVKEFWRNFHKQSEFEAMKIKSRKLQLLQQLQQNDNMSLLQMAKIEEQQKPTIHTQTIENMNRILEEQNQATARFASITDSHTKIYICYNEIINILNTEDVAKDFFEKYLSSIQTVIGNITYIMDSCKSGTITDKDVKQAEILSVNISNIKSKILKDLHDTKQELLIQKQKEDELKQKKLEEAKALELKTAEDIKNSQKANIEQSKRTTPVFYSSKNYNYFKELNEFLEQYEAQYKGLLEDASMKKFRFDCQKAVNTPVNALSSVSGSHIKDKYLKLYKLLKGENVQVLDTTVTATRHPQGLAYCTALLAKKIVKQGDQVVSSNPDAAFPLASVTVALWTQFPEFGKLLEAYFHKFCPYLVPMFLPQKEGQTDKEFYMARGYTYNDEGVVEKQDKFLKRMSGIFRLRCAIWVVKTPKFISAINTHSLNYAWQWLASFVNLKPEPDICATLLNDFFIVCGSQCKKYFGRQFLKVISLISTDYLSILQNIDEGGPKVRLEVFLQNVLLTGVIEPPSGLAEANTW